MAKKDRKPSAGGLYVIFTKEDVENMDTGALVRMLLPAQDSFDAVITCCGYEDDPRELWEIPEVCAYIQQLSQEYPQWIRHLHGENRWMLICLNSGKIMHKTFIRRMLIMMDKYTPEPRQDELEARFETFVRTHIMIGA